VPKEQFPKRKLVTKSLDELGSWDSPGLGVDLKAQRTFIEVLTNHPSKVFSH